MTLRLALALPILLAAALLCAHPAAAQTDGYLQLNDELHTFLERQQALGNLERAFLDEQPLSARRARRYLDTLAAAAAEQPAAFSATDRRLLAQFRGEAPATGAATVRALAPGLYTNGRDFFSVEEGPFRLQVNPLLYLSAGAARETVVAGETPRSLLYRNTRGLRVTGRLGEHFFFHTQLEDNVHVEPMVARSRMRPRLPLAFQRDSSRFTYILSKAAFGYQDRFVEVRLARDRQRWGFARGAMYYSGHAPVHTSLQARVEVWRLSFTAHYAVMDDASVEPASWQHFKPVKYGAFHRLGLSLPGRVSLGVFEGIILAFQPGDEQVGNFVRFLNPLLFYNAVDRESNSPGNVLIGLDAHWVPVRGLAVYSQFILDDFEAAQLFSNPGYWKNTWGLLLGAHVVDVGLAGLDARLEVSRVRPYVYSNLTSSLAHTHREGFLGSPAGPNSETISLSATYRPIPRLQAGLNAFTWRRGRSSGGLNYGEDPHVPYTHNRVSDGEVFTLQGIRQTRHFAEARLGYEIFPSLWVEGAVQHEVFTDAEHGSDRATSFSLQLRWGLPVPHPLY